MTTDQEKIDVYGLALLMIAHGCDNPAAMAQAALDKVRGDGEDFRPFDELREIRARFPMGMSFKIEHDGFRGLVRGYYVRLDGKQGVVGQFTGTNMMHVYGEKWLTAPAPPKNVELPIIPIFRGSAV